MYLDYGECGFPPAPFARLTQVLTPGMAFELHVELPADREDLIGGERLEAARAIREARRLIREDVRRHTQ